MDKGKLISSLALAGLLTASVVGANVNAAAEDEFVKPVGVYKKLIENKVVVPYLLENRDARVTVDDLDKGFEGLTTVNGVAVNDKTAVVGTGTTFVANDVEYTVVVYGDVDGDGAIKANDARVALKNSLKNTLSDVELMAADVDGTAGLKPNDAREILKFAVAKNPTKPLVSTLPSAENPDTVKLAEEPVVYDYTRYEGECLVKIVAEEPLKLTDDLKAADWYYGATAEVIQKWYEETTTEDITITSATGATSTVRVAVDLEALTASYTLSPEKITDGNVEVTLTATKNLDAVVTLERTTDEKGNLLDEAEDAEEAAWTLNWTIDEEDARVATATVNKNFGGIYNVRITDENGSYNVIPVRVLNIDTLNPVVEVENSTDKITAGTVTVTISADEKLALTDALKEDGWSYVAKSKERAIEKVYEENANEEVTVEDLFGRTATVTVVVANIDSNAPKATRLVTDEDGATSKKALENGGHYQSFTLQFTAPIATLKYEDENATPVMSGIELDEDGVYTLTLTGSNGLSAEYTFTVDNVAPEFVYNFDPEFLKEGAEFDFTSIVATDELSGPATVEYTIYDKNGNEVDAIDTTNSNNNGVYTVEFTATDKAGNVQVNATVDKDGNEFAVPFLATKQLIVDTKAAEIRSVRSSVNEETVAKEVTITVAFNEPMQELDGWKYESEDNMNVLYKAFKENDSYSYDFKDLAGNVTNVQFSVSNVDSEFQGVVTYALDYVTVRTQDGDATNQAKATITAEEKLQPVDGWTLSDNGKTLTRNDNYTVNTKETVTVKDLAGNTAEVKVVVDKIQVFVEGIEANTAYGHGVLDNVYVEDGASFVVVDRNGVDVTDTFYAEDEETPATAVNGTYTLIATMDDNTVKKTTTKIAFMYDVTAPVVVVDGEEYTGFAFITPANSITIKSEEAAGYLYKYNAEAEVAEGGALSTVLAGTEVTYSEDGLYEFVARDEAGNATAVIFMIDNQAPEITGVENNSIYNHIPNIMVDGMPLGMVMAMADDDDIVAPIFAIFGAYSVDFRYTNTDNTTINVTNNTAEEALGDGRYTLKVTDPAGNESDVVAFTVVAEAPQLAVTTSNGDFENAARYQYVTFNSGENYDRDEHKVMIAKDGAEATEYTLGKAIKADGSYEVSVVSKETGKALNSVYRFVIDNAKPVVVLTDSEGNVLENGTITNKSVTPTSEDEDIAYAELVINNEETIYNFELGTTIYAGEPEDADEDTIFVEEAAEVLLLVYDESGNLTEVSFVIDLTDPVVLFEANRAGETVDEDELAAELADTENVYTYQSMSIYVPDINADVTFTKDGVDEEFRNDEEVIDNGTYVLTVTNELGNTVTKTFKIDNVAPVLENPTYTANEDGTVTVSILVSNKTAEECKYMNVLEPGDADQTAAVTEWLVKGNTLQRTFKNNQDVRYIRVADVAGNESADVAYVVEGTKVLVENQVQFENALRRDVSEIVVTKSFTTTSTLVVNKDITISGNNATTPVVITGKDNEGVWAASNNFVMQVIDSTVTLKDIAFTGANAGLQVNNSTVTVEGNFDVTGCVVSGVQLTGANPVLDITNATISMDEQVSKADNALRVFAWADETLENAGTIVCEEGQLLPVDVTELTPYIYMTDEELADEQDKTLFIIDEDIVESIESQRAEIVEYIANHTA